VFIEISLLTALFRRRRVFQHFNRKKCVRVFVDFRKGFWVFSLGAFGLSFGRRSGFGCDASYCWMGVDVSGSGEGREQ
jgi:hypothetical protein